MNILLNQLLFYFLFLYVYCSDDDCFMKKRFNYICHTSSIRGILYVGENDVISFSDDYSLIRWNLEINSASNKYIGHTSQVYSAILDGDILYTVGMNGLIISFVASSSGTLQNNQCFTPFLLTDSIFIINTQLSLNIVALIDKRGIRISFCDLKSGILLSQKEFQQISYNQKTQYLYSVVVQQQYLDSFYQNGYIIRINLLNFEVQKIFQFQSSIDMITLIEEEAGISLFFSKTNQQFYTTSQFDSNISSQIARLTKDQLNSITKMFSLQFSKILILTSENKIMICQVRGKEIILKKVLSLSITNRYTGIVNNEIIQINQIDKNSCSFIFSTSMGFFGRASCDSDNDQIEYIDTFTSFGVTSFIIRSDNLMYILEDFSQGIQIYSLTKKYIINELRCFSQQFNLKQQSSSVTPFYISTQNSLSIYNNQVTDILNFDDRETSPFQKVTIQEFREYDILKSIIIEEFGLIITIDLKYINMIDYQNQEVISTFLLPPFNNRAYFVNKVWLFQNNELKTVYGLSCSEFLNIVVIDLKQKTYLQLQNNFYRLDSSDFFVTYLQSNNAFFLQQYQNDLLFKVDPIKKSFDILYQNKTNQGMTSVNELSQTIYILEYGSANSNISYYNISQNNFQKTIRLNFTIYYVEQGNGYRNILQYLNIQKHFFIGIFRNSSQYDCLITDEVSTIRNNFTLTSEMINYAFTDQYLYQISNTSIIETYFNNWKQKIYVQSFELTGVIHIKDKQKVIFTSTIKALILASYGMKSIETLYPDFNILSFISHPFKNLLYATTPVSKENQIGFSLIQFSKTLLSQNVTNGQTALLNFKGENSYIINKLSVIANFSPQLEIIQILNSRNLLVQKNHTINGCNLNLTGNFINPIFDEKFNTLVISQDMLCLIEFGVSNQIKITRLYDDTLNYRSISVKDGYILIRKNQIQNTFFTIIGTSNNFTIITTINQTKDYVIDMVNVEYNLLALRSYNPSTTYSTVDFFNYVSKQYLMEFKIKQPDPILNTIDTNFFYIIDDDNYIWVYKTSTLEVQMKAKLNIMVFIYQTQYFIDKQFNYIVSILNNFNLLYVVKPNISTMILEENIFQSTCTKVKSVSNFDNLDLFVVICEELTMNIFSKSTGKIIQNQELKGKLQKVQFNFSLNFVNVMIDTDNDQLVDQMLNYDISKLAYLSKITLERNRFLKESIQIDIPEKVMYFIGKQALFKYVCSKNFLNLRKMKYIQNNIYLLESSEKLVIWDHLQQTILSSYLIKSTQVEIVGSQDFSNQTILDLFIIRKPFNISIIRLNINDPQLQIIENFNYASGIIKCYNEQLSQFLFIVTQDWYLNIHRKNSTNIVFKQQLYGGSRFELKIIPELILYDQNSIYFVTYNSISSSFFYVYQFYWTTNSQGNTSYFLSQIYFKGINSISNVINYFPTVIVFAEDIRYLDEYNLKFITNITSIQSPYTELRLQYNLPFARLFYKIKIYQDFNQILVFTEYSFAIFNRTVNNPIFQIVDNSFTKNNIIDMTLVSPEVGVITTDMNIFIVEFDVQTKSLTIQRKMEYLFTSDDRQVKIINAYMLVQINSQQKQYSFKIFGYSLFNNEIIDLNIPIQSIQSNSCKQQYENPNLLAIQENLKNVQEVMINKDQEIKLILNLNNQKVYSPMLRLPIQDVPRNLTIIIIGPLVYLDKISFEGFDRVNSMLVFSNATLFLCFNSSISGFSKLTFSNCTFQIGNCRDDVQETGNKRILNLLIKDIKSLEIIKCKINKQQIKNSEKNVIDIQNIENVKFQDLVFEQNEYMFLSSNCFIGISEIKQVYIQQVSFKDNIFKNTTLQGILRFQVVQKLEIQSFQFINNRQESSSSNTQNLTLLYVLQLNGVIQCKVNNINFQENLELGLLQTSPIAKIDSAKMMFENLQMSIIDSSINQNQISQSQQAPISITFIETIQLLNLQIQNNDCLFMPIIFLYEIIDAQFQQLQITNNNASSILLIQNIQRFKYNQGYAVNNTTPNQGAVLQIINQQMPSLDSPPNLILESYFLRNTAKVKGGAIFSSLVDYDISKSQFQQNRAFIGGAIYYSGLQPSFVRNSNKMRMLQNTFERQEKNMFYKNTAYFYGRNIGSGILKIVLDSRRAIDELNFISIQSGLILSDYLLYVVDEENQSIDAEFIINQKNGQLIPQDIKSFINSLEIEILSSNENEVEAKDNNKLIFQLPNFFNMKGLTLQGIPGGQTSYLIFKIPFTVSYNQQGQEEIGKEYKIPISFRDCVIGEIYNQISPQIYKCLECIDNRYSIEIPSHNSIQTCKQCSQQGILSCQKNEIYIQPGYWKWNISSENPIYCYNQPQNCKGDFKTQICSIGYIGPLCQTCDYNGKDWGDRYGRVDTFSCEKCSNTYQMIGRQIFILLGILFHLIYSIRQKMRKAITQINCKTLNSLNWIAVGNTGSVDNLSAYIKFMMSFYQIISIIPLKDSQYGTYLIRNLQNIFGNPTQGLSNSLDCEFSKYDKIPIEYMRIMWSSLLPFFIVLITYLIYGFYVYIITLQTFQTRYIYVTISFSLFYFQSGVLSKLISVISCENIDGVKLIKSELVKECYTKEHIFFISYVFSSIFTFWIILAPALIAIRIYKVRKNLNNPSIVIKYGFYFNEYKEKYFYWEFVRMFVRIIIIFIGNILSSSNQYILKFVLSTTILNIYSIVNRKLMPYRRVNQNKFDSFQIYILNMLFIFWCLSSAPESFISKDILGIFYFLTFFYYQFITLRKIISFMLESKPKIQKILSMYGPKILLQFLKIKKQKNPLKKFLLWRRLRNRFMTIKQQVNVNITQKNKNIDHSRSQYSIIQSSIGMIPENHKYRSSIHRYNRLTVH